MMDRKWSGAGMAVMMLLTSAAAAVATAGGPPPQLASKPVDEWTARLERPDRVAGLKIDYIMTSLGLKPGVTVVDIGAGPGVLTLPIAKTVAPAKVYAVEIEQGFLDHINDKAKQANVTNVVTVLGAFTDPKVPAKDADVVLFHDVLHHIKDRADYLKATAQYVKPGGRIAIVELPPDGSHKDEPALVVTKEQVKGWMAAAGFHPVQEFNGLEGKWFVVYGRS
jgi:2-polyprenyl-3-methyl-5-hydroxy-6-metoxy-1,4-benzoquinol methylase